ncbi:MAG: type I-U CRISPR-associated protein Cas7 [Desulfobacterales bacterium]|nr:type I-U CRISPR-associated protein Cas7 [Desulfobacterales bacterium]
MFEELADGKRLLIEVGLEPAQGDRFQPTGFPDLGAAVYSLADGSRMLLVESAQSMANRLESAVIGPDNELIEELAGLSYIRAHLTGDADVWTNSLIEAHRINSPYIISDKSFQTEFMKSAAYARQKPLDWRKVALAMFRFDVNSLLHGAFLANLGDGRVKMARAVTGFIEAKNVREAVSGGVKNNMIDPTGKLRAKEDNRDVYGNVPYQKVEYTAEEITAYFNLDIGLLKSYALDEGAGSAVEKDAPFHLLAALGLFKIRTFLENGARLRTACDLKVKGELKVTEPDGFIIPSAGELLEILHEKIEACKPLFADPPVTVIDTPTVIKKSKSGEE